VLVSGFGVRGSGSGSGSGFGGQGRGPKHMKRVEKKASRLARRKVEG
jgi:hypothetical protein